MGGTRYERAAAAAPLERDNSIEFLVCYCLLDISANPDVGFTSDKNIGFLILCTWISSGQTSISLAKLVTLL